jgi:hypothetical protein
MNECCGKNYINCNEICEEEDTCRLIYQEEVATPRLHKELDKAFPRIGLR